jgi:hypothetical protein
MRSSLRVVSRVQQLKQLQRIIERHGITFPVPTPYKGERAAAGVPPTID